MKRGEVWWAALDKRRPVVVVQANIFNESRINSVVVVAVTSNLRLADMPGNLRISSRDSGLALPSVVNVTQFFTVPRQSLTECVRTLPAAVMQDIDQGVRLVLGL